MYQQRDGIVIGSSLGPVIAGIIMVELEKGMVPKLKDRLCFWKRYIDNTVAIVKEPSIEHVPQELNSAYWNIQFT